MNKVVTPFENALNDFFEAAKEVRRAEDNFNNAIPEYFEIANDELSVAKKKYEICEKKLRMLEKDA